MTAGAQFWGSHIDKVRDSYRRREYCACTEKELEQRLGRLRSGRDTLVSQSSTEIQQRRAKIAETESQIKTAERGVKEILDKYDWLSRIKYSFWLKISLSVAALFWKKALSAKEVNRRLPEITQKLKDAEENIDYLTRLRFKQRQALQRIAGPIDELNDVIACLEQQLDDVGREAADCDKAILDAIQFTARSTPAESIKTRLADLAGRTDIRALSAQLFRLRAVLTELDAIDRGAESELAETDSSAAPDRLQAAVADSLYGQSRPGNGQIHVSGRGTSHVRKTRRRMVTDRDAHGRTRTRHKTESYWAKINVSFEGNLLVPFDLTYNRWQADPTAAAVRDEATTAFALAVQQFRKTSLQKHEDALVRQASTLTREIRDIVARDF